MKPIRGESRDFPALEIEAQSLVELRLVPKPAGDCQYRAFARQRWRMQASQVQRIADRIPRGRV